MYEKWQCDIDIDTAAVVLLLLLLLTSIELHLLKCTSLRVKSAIFLKFLHSCCCCYDAAVAIMLLLVCLRYMYACVLYLIFLSCVPLSMMKGYHRECLRSWSSENIATKPRIQLQPFFRRKKKMGDGNRERGETTAARGRKRIQRLYYVLGVAQIMV